MTRSPRTIRRRESLRLRDGDNCHICGKPIDFTMAGNTGLAATLDHIVPKYKGGVNALSNLKLAHAECNRKRGCGWARPGTLEWQRMSL